jgi:hypothetical protein
MKNILLLFAIALMFSCKDAEPLTIPDHMLARYDKNEKCGDFNYVNIHFPDSSVFMTDTVDYINLYNDTTHKRLSMKNENTYFYFVLTFFLDHNNTHYPTKYIFPGEYKLSDPTIHEQYNPGARIRIEKYIGEEPFSILSQLSSNYIILNGAYGDDFEMTICGEFDVILSSYSQPEPVHVTGDFRFTLFNSFI